MKIVYVHGIAQERKPAAVLHAQWDDALREGLRAAGVAWPAGATTAFPYYGDVLADKTAEVDRQEALGLIPRGDGPPADAEQIEFHDEVLRDMAAVHGVSTEALADADGQPVARGLQNWRWVLALSRRLNAVGPLADWSIDSFTRDVWVYLHHLKVRAPIHRIVDADLPQAEPCVVVAHSLGSVVAYNVLMARAERSHVRGWVTLGSPLGIQAIHSRLPSAPTRQRRSAPPGVGAWYNARDARDMVALHPVPAAGFSGTPAVENGSHVDNGTSNRHGIAGYLGDAEVARRIAALAAA